MELQFRLSTSKQSTLETSQFSMTGPSRLMLATVASQRAKQLMRGALPRILAAPGAKATTVAIAEVHAGQVTYHTEFAPVFARGQVWTESHREPPTAFRPAAATRITLRRESDSRGLGRSLIYSEAPLRRQDFGVWGKHLSVERFWRAVAMLGAIDGESLTLLSNPRTLGAVEIEIANLAESERLEPAGWSGLPWNIDEDVLSLARAGGLPDAGWLAGAWDELTRALPSNLPLRIASGSLFSNHSELAQWFDEHLKATFFCVLQPLLPGEEWHWPIRVTVPSSAGDGELRRQVDEGMSMSGVKQLRAVAARDSETEFLVLRGDPAEALRDVEQVPIPIRAHCVLLVTDGSAALDQTQYQALLRVRTLTFAQGVVLVHLQGRSVAGWIESLARVLRSTQSAIEAVVGSAPSSSTYLFEPKVFANASRRKTSTILAEWDFDELLTSRHLFARLEGFSGLLGAGRPSQKLQPDDRRLQVRITANNEDVEAFAASTRHEIATWIGTTAGSRSAPFRFSRLPFTESGHLLTVTLVAPAVLERPLLETVYLPSLGDSTRCAFTITTGQRGALIEARLTIAFRNRILQTYLIRGRAGGEPWELLPEMATQHDWQGLDSQSSYGASVVLNKLSGKPLAVVQWGYKAYPFSLEGLGDAITEIESKIDSSQWDSDAFQGVRATGSARLLLFLAKHGFSLLEGVKGYVEPTADGRAFLDYILQADPIQVLAANLGARLPIEFFYANPHPDDKAVLCPTYDADPGRERCDGCTYVDEEHYCPLGFWSLHKVIEWHDFEEAKQRLSDFAPRAFAIQGAGDDSRRDRLRRVPKALVGISEKAGAVDRNAAEKMLQEIRKAGIETVVAADWEDWKAKVASETPALLVLVPHSLKNDFGEECLEIAGNSLASAKIKRAHVTTESAPGPVVLLIGCNTDNFGVPYRNFEVKFMNAGAAVVVSTIAHVLGRHAAPLAAEVVKAMAVAQTAGDRTFGRLMLDVRRTHLRSNDPPLVLALKTYGDARWRF